ncbi:hypothetical protein K461DRAFT_307549 [Myriangium duriaei CBS 260.36]|uniref:Uncharacterized protein n=1 Tax=Myriangium duriaei CBS 260.36 TaxID=1168546 RepID=A0A9P4MID7_9PEZI|nr:hypothetical protein K461DRAFT_307549 [Myriangium duriaei CBS 260.36]
MTFFTLDTTSSGDFVPRNHLDGSYHDEPITWGFLLARTSASATWDVALAKIKEYLRFQHASETRSEDNTETMAGNLIMSRLGFVILDAEELRGANDQPIRQYCQRWRDSFVEKVPGCIHTKADDEFDEHGPCYRGWIRTTAMHLTNLWSDLKAREFDVVAPTIEVHGQISIYEGNIGGQRIDPPDGISGRLRLMGRHVPEPIWGDVRRVERENMERTEQVEHPTNSADAEQKDLASAMQEMDA